MKVVHLEPFIDSFVHSSFIILHSGRAWWSGPECAIESFTDGKAPAARESDSDAQHSRASFPRNRLSRHAFSYSRRGRRSLVLHSTQEYVRPHHVSPVVPLIPSSLAEPALSTHCSLAYGRETEPDYDVDIAEDVGEECSRYGKVVHIRVLKDSAGLVYIKMDSPDAARQVQQALNHRWFAGKMITAEFVPEQVRAPHFIAFLH